MHSDGSQKASETMNAEDKGGIIFKARIAVIEEIEKHTYRGVLAGSDIGTRLDALIAAVREDERKRRTPSRSV